MTASQPRRLVKLLGLAALGLLAGLPGADAADAADKQDVGEWSKPINFENVPIHTHVLPDGQVLYWGRREKGEDLNPHNCTPRIWNPKTKTEKATHQPGFNLFCGGHAHLPDGRLLVVGGHLSDGHGHKHATLFDYKTGKWTTTKDMNAGRWYPTALTLPDGSVLVSFGTKEDGGNNTTQQVWKDGDWKDTVGFDPPPYYPRMHVVPDGRAFMSGPLALTQFLDPAAKQWTFLRTDPDINKAVQLSSRINNFRDYAPSILFAEGKILFVGGGDKPTNAAEVLDLNAKEPGWKPINAMRFPRRQHNGTLLPDGTVLVTGGTQGGGFNDLTIGSPIRAAELWDPKTGKWKVLAEESVDRCYHSTAVLLPDATVLSAGGGEYSPKNDGQANDPKDSHRNGQIFCPPYLFKKGKRPDIVDAPTSVGYGEKFEVKTSHPDDVGAVNWVKLSSVTHSFNTDQRINFLTFTVSGPTALTVAAPAKPSLCTPGHYMLFVLNKDGFPSVAKIIQIK
jgi:hypothetical protein